MVTENRALSPTPSTTPSTNACDADSATRPTALVRIDARMLAATDPAVDADSPPVWRQFRNPAAVLAAYHLDEVPRVLREVDRHAAAGRWCVGFVAYEAAPAFDPALVTHPAHPHLPLAWFAVHDAALPAAAPERPAVLAPRDAPRTGPTRMPDEDAYRSAVREIHRQIADGNSYQVNLTVPLRAELTAGTPEGLFAELYARQPTEYAAFLDLGEQVVLSASPELFFERRGDAVTMRPMKGTVARGGTPEQDDANRRWLLASVKNRAENTMIVDLLRNDLGRIARTGTVRVEQLVALETYPTFHALTSTIGADCAVADLLQIFAALFPCGSITGAPKASTMRIITELEDEPRGVYCGAVGVVAPGGDARFSVAIRTAVVGPGSAPHPDSAPTGGVLRYGVGGGITTDSTADEEYAELLVKSRIVRELPGPDLLETFRLQDGEAVNLALHLRRLLASAAELGYPTTTVALQRAVRALLDRHPAGTWRARLLLSRTGGLHTEAAAFDPDALRSMTATVSTRPVLSSDLRLRHKLTDRSAYDARRDPRFDTTVLVNERNEVTELLYGNLVVRRAGRLITPPLSSGLLPGVGRALAIADGVAVETVGAGELAGCDELWHVNSLRGWIPLVLQG